MTKKEKEYQKIRGIKKGFLIGKYTLWQGGDHLLQVYSRVGVEDYKRFYFNDIQAIITRKTTAGKIQNIVLGLLLLLFTLPAVLNDGGWSAFWATLAAVLLILVLVNLLRGPTCETKLLTAVQTEKLHSLHRLKNAVKVMNRLRSVIQSVQGKLSREDQGKIPVRRVSDNAVKGSSQRTVSLKTLPRQEKGRCHLVLFSLLVLYGGLTSAGFLFNHVIVTFLSAVAAIGMGIFVIIALVKQHNTVMSNTLQVATWASLGFVAIIFVAGYSISVVFAFKNPDLAYNQWELFKAISNLSPWENPLILALDIFAICGGFILGIVGLLTLKQTGNRVKEDSATQAEPLHRPIVSGKTAGGLEEKVS
ncbi:MAG: hypothetical protein PVH85_31360 [Desulfobacterales bacterium]|jgi:hypothetical protein